MVELRAAEDQPKAIATRTTLRETVTRNEDLVTSPMQGGKERKKLRMTCSWV